MNETTNNVTNESATPKVKRKGEASVFYKATPSGAYNPPAKPLSKRDKWRQEVAARKQK